MHKNIYLIVTNDEYELPVAERIGIRACSEFIGLTEGTIASNISKNQWGKRSKYKVVLLGRYEKEFDKKKYDKAYYQEYIKTHDRSEYFKKRWREKHG